MKKKLFNLVLQILTKVYNLFYSLKLKIAICLKKTYDQKESHNITFKLKNIIYFYAYKLHFNLLLKFSFNIIFFFLFQLFFNFSTFHEVFASETVHNAIDPDDDHKWTKIIVGFGIILTIAFFGYLIWPETPTDIPDPEPFNAVDAVLRDIPPYLYP